MKCETTDYMHFNQIFLRLNLNPRESVVSPINSHYANSLLFRTRGLFLFLKLLKNAKQQQRTTTYCSSGKQCLN